MILPLQNYFAICVYIHLSQNSSLHLDSGKVYILAYLIKIVLSHLNEAILACAIFKGFQCTITSSIIPQGRPIHVDLPLIEWH